MLILVGLTDECPTEEHINAHVVPQFPCTVLQPYPQGYPDKHIAHYIRDREELERWATEAYEIHRIVEAG